MKGTTKPDWSSLPEDLLVLIAKCLQTRTDKRSFGAVCTSFRSSVASLPKLSSAYQNLEYIPDDSPATGNYFFHLEITECIVCAIEPPISEISDIQQHSTKPWLIKLEETSSGKRQIRNLLFKDTPKMLRKKTLNLLNYRLTELSKAYKLELVKDKECKFNRRSIFCAHPVISTDEDGNSALMAIVDYNLVVWRAGNKKGTIIDLVYNSPRSILDITYHNKKFYVLISGGRALTVDAKSLKVNEVVATPNREWTFLVKKYFAKSSNALFLMKEYWSGRYCQVYVFKIDEEKREWNRVKDGWEDRALFLEKDGNFFAFAQEFSGLKCSCIYIPIDRDCMIINLKDETRAWLSSSPHYFKSLWPPPAWLCNALS